MDLSSKRVLFVDLEAHAFEIKTFPDLKKYVGGVSLGLKLYEQNIDKNPVVFAVGPLNGLFPFVSKTAVIFFDEKNVEDVYLGGYLSNRIRFSNLDAVVILNKSKLPVLLDTCEDKVNFLPVETDTNKLGLPGKRSALKISETSFLLDDYFISEENSLHSKLLKKNLFGIVITATKNMELKNPDKYAALYEEILNRAGELSVESAFFPSCSGCPMGCEKSKYGEIGGNILTHSLVACEYASAIFNDVGTVFSCLNVLGYDYTHEDLENLGDLVKDTLKNLE